MSVIAWEEATEKTKSVFNILLNAKKAFKYVVSHKITAKITKPTDIRAICAKIKTEKIIFTRVKKKSKRNIIIKV